MASLRISGHQDPWYFKGNKTPHDTICTSVPSGDRVDASGLSLETDYLYTAYSDSTTPLASTAFPT